MDPEQIKQKLLPLPDMPAIIGRSHMFCSAVLIPLIRRGDDYSLLFQKRAAHIRQGGEVGFPGGRFDEGSDKDFKATAVRETCEELGISENKVEILGSPGTLISSMDVLVHCYLGILDIESLDELNPNEDEVEDLFTLPLAWFDSHPADEYRLPLRAHPWTIDEQSGQRTDHFPSVDLDLPEKYRDSWEGLHKIWSYRTEYGTIWGITAQILVEILPLLKK